jgi:hypothetical protein
MKWEEDYELEIGKNLLSCSISLVVKKNKVIPVEAVEDRRVANG